MGAYRAVSAACSNRTTWSMMAFKASYGRIPCRSRRCRGPERDKALIEERDHWKRSSEDLEGRDDGCRVAAGQPPPPHGEARQPARARTGHVPPLLDADLEPPARAGADRPRREGGAYHAAS